MTTTDTKEDEFFFPSVATLTHENPVENVPVIKLDQKPFTFRVSPWWLVSVAVLPTILRLFRP